MYILVLSLITLSCFAQEVAIWNESTNFETDKYFNTTFLGNYSLVADSLVTEEQFQHIEFTTEDGIQIKGLERRCVDASCSVICCAGFLPGRKEGLASLVRLLPSNANILFFDARGHGSSSGRFLTNLHRYGLNEYKDIKAAIEHIKKNCSNTPIFLHGTCAGAYHAATTLLTIPEDHQIRGLIFDSGFTNPLNSMDIPGEYCKEKIAPGIFAKLYKVSKEKARNRYFTKILGALAAGFFRILGICVYPFLKPHTDQLDLLAKVKVQSLNYPVLFIHAVSDKFAKIDSVKELAANMSQKDEWWIPDAQKEGDPRPEHALNQIKCKHEYIKRLKDFISKQLATQKTVPGDL